MFKPVSMCRLRLILLEQDERAVLCYLGIKGAAQLTRLPAGPETAPLPPRDRRENLARMDNVLSRLGNLRRSLDLPPADISFQISEVTPAPAESDLEAMEKEAGEWMQRRQLLRQQVADTATVTEQLSDYGNLELPLDAPDDSSFLHFVTGSLPAKNVARFDAGPEMALLPLRERDGRQIVIAISTRQNRPVLDRALNELGFQTGRLPVVAGCSATELLHKSESDRQKAGEELKGLDARLLALGRKFSPVLQQMEIATIAERQLLDAEQNFSRTENSILLTGWLPNTETIEVERHIRQITRGCCIVEVTPAEQLDTEEIPVLLTNPRWLRPFAMLVTAYGLPGYRELEPTLFVAISYLLMFGMMFGDIGHGFIFTLIGAGLLIFNRGSAARDLGLLLSFAGVSSMVFGALYGSCFGIEWFKKYALWRDPLAGDPMSLMFTAIGIGIALISLGLVLNTINRFRHGDITGALLDKFGLAGGVFYWLALILAAKSAEVHARGLFLPAVLLLAVMAVAWAINEPIHAFRHRHAGASTGTGLFNVAMESFVSVFEGLLSYFANTISFVRLAAYAMSHAALLLAAFMIADDVKHFSYGGGFLAVMVIIAGNLVALVLEGIVASVQALRLEYYEFFGKFFSGGGKPFQPFCLNTTTVANTPH